MPFASRVFHVLPATQAAQRSMLLEPVGSRQAVLTVLAILVAIPAFSDPIFTGRSAWFLALLSSKATAECSSSLVCSLGILPEAVRVVLLVCVALSYLGLSAFRSA